MNCSRRSALGLGTAFTVEKTLGSISKSDLPVTVSGHEYFLETPALNQIAAYATEELSAFGLPGMTIALADNRGRQAKLAIGWGDRELRMPLKCEKLFQIGSITKSLTALCVHSLAEKGVFEINADVKEFLPEIRWPETSITIGHLLNHTSGLPREAGVFPNVPGEKLWLDFPPGSRSRYSNLGYELLGILVSRVTSLPFHRVLRERILQPLGMLTARSRIIVDDRNMYPTSYVPACESHQLLSGAPLVPAEFDEFSSASGCVAATANDMASYLSYVLRLGRGEGGVILSDRQAKQLLLDDAASTEFSADGRYASGFGKVELSGVAVLHHTGGMQSFVSSFHADPGGGHACWASVNGRLIGYRPKKVTAYAIQVMRKSAECRLPVKAPIPLEARKVNAINILGKTYRNTEGVTFQFFQDAGQVKLLSGDRVARVEQKRQGVMVTDHERFRKYALEAISNEYDAFWWGEELFEANRSPRGNVRSPELTPLAGEYSSGRPQEIERIFVRWQKLIREDAGTLVRSADGYWYSADSSEERDRILFGGLLGGTPSYININGKMFNRR